MIKLIQKEVECAQKELAEAEKAAEKVDLRGKMIGALHDLRLGIRSLEQDKILCEWVEQQRQVLASKEQLDGLGNQAEPGIPRLNGLLESRVGVRKGKKSTSRPVLSQVDPAKVSKTRSGRTATSRRQRRTNSKESVRLAEKNSDPSSSIPQPNMDRISKSTATSKAGAAFKPLPSHSLIKSGQAKKQPAAQEWPIQ